MSGLRLLNISFSNSSAHFKKSLAQQQQQKLSQNMYVYLCGSEGIYMLVGPSPEKNAIIIH